MRSRRPASAPAPRRPRAAERYYRCHAVWSIPVASDRRPWWSGNFLMERMRIEDEVRVALSRWDAAFAASAAEPLAELFAEDAQLLLLYDEPTVGRANIRDRWAAFFAKYDTSAWEVSYDFVAGCDQQAVSLGIYTERLRERATDQVTLIRGRVVYIWRQDGDGAWRILRAVNSHSHKPERVT